MSERYELLDQIEAPSDVKRLRVDQLPQLCDEVRAYLLAVLSEVPGHLAAGLGVVELTVALHYVLDLPNDQIVWDVGHQAYPHKILSGRKDALRTIRQWGGLSGFVHPQESAYDAFISGHASTSISAALGLSVASQLQGEKHQVVAVIGDGAMTGGLAFEGLNNASICPNNLMIILNDNHISIDPITGGLSKYLTKITGSWAYNKLRYKGYQGLKKLNLINERRRSSLTRFNNSIKALLNDETNLFEGFSIRYFGPLDGHDVRELVARIEQFKSYEGPKLLHVKSIKGKGYKPAEECQVTWHAPGKFVIDTGERMEATAPQPDKPLKFQEIFGKTLLELAENDERVVGVTPAMISGSSFNYMQEKYPERLFDVGIAEGHAVTFSSGLSRRGQVVFCNIYSSFLQRAYDQVIHDVAMQNTPLILCIDRAGLVGEDGVTHHGLYDIPALRTIPGLTLMSPYDEKELRLMMYTAYRHYEEGIYVIRYPRGTGSCVEWEVPLDTTLEIGKAEVKRSGKHLLFISYGPCGVEVSKAIADLENKGYQPGHINLRFLKPLDKDTLLREVASYDHIITVEDGSIAGGMGSAILELLSDAGISIPVTRLGIEDIYIKQGSVTVQREYAGIDAKSIAQRAMAILINRKL